MTDNIFFLAVNFSVITYNERHYCITEVRANNYLPYIKILQLPRSFWISASVYLSRENLQEDFIYFSKIEKRFEKI